MLLLLLLAALAAFFAFPVRGDLGLGNGFISFNTSAFRVQLVKDSQTAYLISPLSGSSSSVNYIPADYMSYRVSNNQYHLGDITFRARVQGASSWTTGNSAASRAAVTAVTISGALAAANLTPTLGTAGSLLRVIRRWVASGSELQLLFDVTNIQTSPVEIGSIGAPLEFNNIFTDRTAADTNTKCSLFDPYIGADAGYVQVTPLLGTLQPLVVLPASKSPLEGWRFLSESTSTYPYYQSQTFEGLHEWMFHTSAYASSEWASTTPWNAATSVVLAANQTRTYGLRFVLASSIKTIDAALISVGHPVANAVPGYTLSRDAVGKLFLRYGSAVSSFAASPSGALTVAAASDTVSSGWAAYDVTPSSSAWGRVRLSITYADGTLQTVHYFVTNAATQRIADLGSFLTNQQWYTNTSDPFLRAPSVISYDRELNKQVVDEARAWIAGLSDEAGAGSFLAAAMKQYLQPVAAEVTKMEQFVNTVVWGKLQGTDYTVKKSLYYYDKSVLPSYSYPSSIDYGNWWSWNKASAYAYDRAYDYVHVVATYWAMYRVARNYPSLVTQRTWQWYLNQAMQTIIRMTGSGVGYVDVGLMGETVYWYTLNDLKREGLTANVTSLQNAMKARQTIWAGQRYPFGSEMAWDSTGQEGVYIWSKYFNDSTTATNTLNSILAFQPSVPHWGYDGNARRYWDNIYGGKLQRIERQIHHYGSGLNALPLIYEFYTKPTEYYLLRVGYSGLLGSQTNIDQSGFAAAAFHTFPDTMKWDAYSGDYGPNFSGHAMGIGAFVLQHPDFGWQAYGGRVTSSSSTSVAVTILDDGRRRVYIAPLGTLFSLDAGAFISLTYNPSTKSTTFTLASKPSVPSTAAAAPSGRIVVTQLATISGVGTLAPTTSLTSDGGAYVVPFSSGSATVTFQ
ncbi:hypothetical protein BKA62DRAFT_622444 [Auriculariales sp. MPI-PUGE-AT-0066]|nr:hypothetical protein BKA62DRAFT_622444 [Auriculariales sp. MPI-PUGE-AT-0066]